MKIKHFYTLMALSMSMFFLGNVCKAANHNTLDLPNKSHLIANKIQLIIEQGDITKKNVDSIVNAANEDLARGDGVCGAIFKAAGWQKLQNACNNYPVIAGKRCPVGSACITPSFELEKYGIKHIIHAVGPDCRIVKDEIKQDELLYSAYYDSLKLADSHEAQSIAFPFISSGIYGFPKKRAALIAVQAINDYIQKNHRKTHLKTICITLFSEEDKKIFDALLDSLI